MPDRPAGSGPPPALPPSLSPSLPGLPLVGLKGAGLALALALLMAWPMLATTAPLVYFDTADYVSDGRAALALLRDLLADLASGPATAPPLPEGADGITDGITGPPAPADSLRSPAREVVVSVRSAAYAVYVGVLSQTPLGLVLPTILQGALAIFMALALVPAGAVLPEGAALAGLAVLALLSPLPWFVSYAMPDILAAALVLYYGLLLGRIDAARPGQAALLGLIAVFATLAHYGNPPLAGVLAGAVLAVRALRRRLPLRVVLLAVLPVLAPLPVNLAANVAATGTASAAPNRLPILLARSLQDGPARWYLQDACPDAGYAICALFEGAIPGRIADFLWAEDGIRQASPDQMRRIRAEETTILIEAFKAYPLAQSRALFGNAALQVVTLGTGELLPLERAADGAMVIRTDNAARYPVLTRFDALVWIGPALGLAVLAGLAGAGRLTGPVRDAAALAVFAALVNAAIFGGLSAPVDRYQSRLAWVFPALALLALLRPRPPTPRPTGSGTGPLPDPVPRGPR